MNNPPEHSDEAGAQKLAQQIIAYWAKRGYAVKAVADNRGSLRTNRNHTETFWSVRSDMTNGMPTRKIERVAA